MLQHSFRGFGLLLVLVLLAAPPSAAEVLFADNFDAQPDWTGNPDPPSIGGKCFVDTCNNLPEGWSFYRTTRCDIGKCSLTIENGPLGGSGKFLYYWLEPTLSGESWINDGILSWHDNDNQYPEIWVRYEIRWDPDWVFYYDGYSPQMKQFRISHYIGDGTQANDPTWPIDAYINPPHSHQPNIYNGWQRAGGGCATLLHYFSPRCGEYEECVGADWNNLRYFWNYSEARYCDGSAEPQDEQCLLPASPFYKPSLGASRCDDGTCSGSLVPGSSITDPADYSGSGGAYCSGGRPGPMDTWFDFGSPGFHGDGEWHTVTHRAKMNSAFGAADGIYEVWMDGVKVHRRTEIVWRPVGSRSDVTGFNHVGFGGNAFYVHTGPGEQWYAMDNVVIATSEADLDNAWVAACIDGRDNDGDGLADGQDPGCSGEDDRSENDPAVACDDGVDNDGDGLVDYRVSAGDPGCAGPTDNDENNCNNGILEVGEECDGTLLSGQNCMTQGFDSGTLTCSPECRFDTSQCALSCGEIASKDGWSATADSWESDPSWATPPALAIDGQANTFWLTEWVAADPPQPHTLDIDLGAVRVLCGFTYLPRQSSPVENGVIRDYEVYVSGDGQIWSLTDSSSASGPLFQSPYSVSAEPVLRRFVNVPARFLRLRSLSEINGNPWTSAAEVGVLENTEIIPGDELPPNVQNVIRTDTED